MKDKYKSKEQLILEIQQLHHCLCDLEKSKESFKKANRKLKKLAKERDAELTRAKKELNAERKKSKQLGEALQESNEITSALLNTPAEIFTLLNNDGTVLAANQVLAKRLKVPLEDLIGKKVFDWFSQELTESRRNHINKVVECEKPIRVEDYRNGIWYDNIIYPVLDIHGKVTHVAVFARDITRHIHAQEELKKAQEELRVIFDSIRAMIWTKDKKGRYLQVNRAFCEDLGLVAEKIIGLTDYDFQKKEIADQYSKNDRKVLRTGKPVLGIIENYTNPSGELGWCLTDKFPYCDIKGALLGTIGFAIDITDLKKTQEALKESEERYRSFVQNFQGIAYQSMFNWIPLFFHGDVELITGYREIDFIKGKPRWYEIIHPDDRAQLKENASELRKVPGFSIMSEYRIITKDGEVKWLRDHVKNICGKSKKPSFLQGTIYDITEQRKAKEELQKAHKLESLGVLAGGIAHDFNNLLGSLFGFIDLARECVDTDSEISSYLNKAMSAYTRARNLTNQLLTFSKGGEPVKTIVDIGGLLRDSVNLVLSGSSIRCNLEFDKKLHLIEADEGQLSQVFHNILLNARQAMPGGGTITIKALNKDLKQNQVHDLDKGQYVEISVRDNGTGMPDKLLPKIFDPFFTTKQQGSGLGLTTSYSIIRKHIGHITVESDMGVGTTVIILLPATKKQKAGKPEKLSMMKSGTGRILLMDDEQIILDTVSQLLSRMGYHVEPAKDGEEAIDLFKKKLANGVKFDIVILDLTVQGGMGGDEAIKKLIELDPEVKAVVSSGYSDSPVLANPEEYGFMDTLAKPYIIKDLSRVLYRLLKDTE